MNPLKLLANYLKSRPLSANQKAILNALQDGELRGMDLSKAIEINIGHLYPALRDLESRGLIDSQWVDDSSGVRGGARARVYRLVVK